MERINFIDNVTKANANTFNTLQDNIENSIELIESTIPNGFCKAILNSNYSYTSSSSTKLTLVSNINVNDKFSISSGGIKIGAGINYVRITAQAYFTTGVDHSDGKTIQIFRNTTLVDSVNSRQNQNYFGINCSNIIPVNEDDVIYLNVMNNTSRQTTIGGGEANTFLIVEELK